MTNAITLDLTKKFELNLEKAGITQIPVLETRLAVDRSGSMQEEFDAGWVDKTINLFIVAAMKFDDNQSLEVGFFNTEFTQTPEAQAGDVGTYLKSKARNIRPTSGTYYAPIIENLESKMSASAPIQEKKSGFFGFFKGDSSAPASKERVAKNKAYVGVITDGDPGDKRSFESALANTSGDTFYQFIAIGNQIDANYLKGLSNQYKHVSFIHLKDPYKVTDDSFYENLCNEKFVAWTK
ncbi:Von Willebrand factor type A domain-containing protein [Rhizobium phage RHph_Y65]|uniref:von Willebrand factor type A domain-containing protein n=1 Tax=Rhizobium phage RHph_Y65 TaxID=2509785 RepID=A0A7S5R868_9CAUD|nr:Von Willebrand factor type A domain-containing protein [Rhizobium phage RHph_Y65]QIG72787.1 Von Willebrand factor type A domain-containing protein [Rhizobium phage RHph_Y65]QIG77815.1 Von Willebrand factor type A domain-containing protein [Rhizobium phage RHph_TM61]